VTAGRLATAGGEVGVAAEAQALARIARMGTTTRVRREVWFIELFLFLTPV
jgi:hypothetical protein